MPRNYLWRRSDLLPMAALALVVVLFWGFRSWSGVRAAEVRDFPAALTGQAVPLTADAGPAGGTGPRLAGGVRPGNCCAVWRGGCGYPGSGSPVLDTQALEQSALERYRQQTGDPGPVEVRLRDFGCHVQADIYKAGQRVKSYSYWGGQWQEIDY